MAALACIGCRLLALASWGHLHGVFAFDDHMHWRIASPHLHQLWAIAWRLGWANWNGRNNSRTKNGNSKKQQQSPRKVFDVGMRCACQQRRMTGVLALDPCNLCTRMAWAMSVIASRHRMACATGWASLAALTLTGGIAATPVIHASNSLCGVALMNFTETNPVPRTISRHGLKKWKGSPT